MPHALFSVAAGAGLAGIAAAQTPSFTYHLAGAPAFASPGQTFSLTVLCGFTPGVGGIVNTGIGPYPVLGLSSGSFNIVASSGSWSGLALISPYNFLGTMPGTIVGSNVNGAIWGNGFGPPLGTVSTVNPTPVWQATFTFPATITFPLTITLDPVGNHGVWAGNPGEFAVELLSQATTGAQVAYIPSPAGAAVLGLAGLVAVRRRR